MNKPVYSKYSTERDKQFQIRTDILIDESGKKTVVKTPYSPSAQCHIDSIYDNYKLLDRAFENSAFSVNKCEKCNKGLEFEYIDSRTLEQQLNEFVQLGDYQAVLDTLKDFIHNYKGAFDITPFSITEDFKKVFGSVAFPCSLDSFSPCNIDSIAGNVFLHNGKWCFIDYEWTFNFPVPFLYVVYRLVFYYLLSVNDKHLKEIGLMRLFGISEDLEACFSQMEHNFQLYVYGSMGYGITSYPDMLKPSVNLSQLLTASEAFNKTHSIRVFYDYGNGFSGEHSDYITPDSYIEKEQFYTFSIPVKNAKRLRIDPYEDCCVISNMNFTEGRSVLKAPEYTTNGYCHNDMYIFATLDPIIVLDNLLPESEVVNFSCCMYVVNSTAAINLVKALEENVQLQSQVNALSEKFKEQTLIANSQKEHIQALESENSILLNETVKSLEERAHKLEEKNSILSDEISNRKSHEESMWNDILFLQKKNENLNFQLHTIQSAFFWKITYPFRKITDFLKFILKKFKSLLKKIVLNSFVKNILKFFDKILQFTMRGAYNKTFGKLKAKLKRKMMKDTVLPKTTVNNDSSWIGELPIHSETLPLVSIIVPNYNHSAYLRERLDSIYAQTYTNYEVILLDDCSTDNSREILTEYAQKHPDNTKTYFNETNAGFVFKQWNKGISLAKGDYIWIAESDDYCSENFLEELVKQFDYQSVMLSFVPSIFMQDGKQIWSSGEYLSDLPEFDLSKPFIMSAHNAVNKGFAIKNIIPNVSSMMFRNIGKIPQEVSDIWQNIRLCGDWIFYLSIIKGGTISYTNTAVNYYRVHKESTSLKIQETMDYYKEQMIVSEFVAKNYNIDLDCFDKVKHNLMEHYKAFHHTADDNCILKYYDTDKIRKAAAERKINIVMCCFALKIGGGETYPIYLANELKELGYPVTLLNFNMEQYDPDVRKMLNPDVPLVNISDLSLTYLLISRLGADIAHSHHGSVDNILSLWLKKEGTPKHVITLHGMYETIDSANLNNLLNDVDRSCSHFIYIADKNLKPFENDKRFPQSVFTKIGNGLPQSEVTPVDRAQLGIEEDAFVLCIVSRGIMEKGWAEAVEAVTIANKQSSRKIHLVIVGNGPAYDKLIGKTPDFVHLVGRKNNTRDYFAMADMGFLPTRFKGESYPLVVIDSLFCGKPVIATSIAEVENQLTDENGEKAGITFELDNWKVPVKKVADIISEVANSPELYNELKSRVLSASKKFDIKNIIKEYLKVYKNL